MKAHAPKTAALLAFDADLLSTEAERILRKHLNACQVCTTELASIRAYDSLSEQMRASQTPEIDWNRMELALRREARVSVDAIRKQKSDASSSRYAAAGLAAAAVLAVVGPGVLAKVNVDAVEPAPSLIEVASVSTSITGTVTASAGRVHRQRASGVVTELRVDDMLDEGDRILAAAGSTVHARLESGTGIIVSPSTDVTLASMTDERIQLELASGTVTNRVHRLGAQEQYEVIAGAYRVVVRGTQFSVTRTGDDISVVCTEGAVDVFHDDTLVQQVRPAEGTFGWASASNTIAHAVAQGLELPVLAEQNARLVTFMPSENILEWQVNGAHFDAAGRMAMRVAASPLEITALDINHREMRVNVSLDSDSVIVDPVRLFTEAGTAATAGADTIAAPREAAPLAPGVIERVVRASSDRLTRCYERALRLNPSLDAHMSVRVTVDALGRVTDARLNTQSEPSLNTCVIENVRGWVFPARPGASASTANIPLNFGRN